MPLPTPRLCGCTGGAGQAELVKTMVERFNSPPRCQELHCPWWPDDRRDHYQRARAAQHAGGERGDQGESDADGWKDKPAKKGKKDGDARWTKKHRQELLRLQEPH